MFSVVQILIFGSVWISVTCQLPECKATRCSCCKDNVCRSRDDFCKNGCIDGIWSNRCYNACPDNCNACTQSSVDGGRPCTSCITGKYGENCEEACAAGCVGSTCDKLDGRCTCIAGYSGDKCDTVVVVCPDKCLTCTSSTNCQTCVDGYYNGYRYSGSNGEYTSVCKHLCMQNCEACTEHDKCSKCIDGRHGFTCTEICPVNCADTFCNNDGSCNSCKPGFHGSKCESECLQNCDECNEKGKCIKCTKGYFGDNCDRCQVNCTSCSSISYCSACYPGFYGSICQSRCSRCKEGTKCSKSNGYCDEACKDGVYDSNCNSKCNYGCVACDRNYGSRCTVCANGRYGKNSGYTFYHCNNYCSSNCLKNACNGSTGYCDTCIEGYKGDLCDCPVNCQCAGTGECDTCVDNFANIDKNCTECALNLYGVDCQTECNNKCLDNDQNTKCHVINGTCIVGCVHGLYGDRCDLPCDQNCLNGTCSRLKGMCSYGCKDGFIDSGAICVIAEDSVGHGGIESGAVIGGSVGGVVAVLAVVGVLMFVFLRRRCVSKDNVKSSHNYVNTRPEASDPEVETTPDYEEPDEVPPNMQTSAPQTDTTNEYEELDVGPQNMQRSGLSAGHNGDADVIGTGNTYEPLSRPAINTDVYSHLEHNAYENTTI